MVIPCANSLNPSIIHKQPKCVPTPTTCPPNNLKIFLYVYSNQKKKKTPFDAKYLSQIVAEDE